MTKLKLITCAAFVITGFIACKDSATQAQQDATNLNKYVDSVDALTPVYTSVNWADLQNGYEVRLAKTNDTRGTLEPSDKTKVEESKVQWASLKTNYSLKINETEATAAIVTPDYRQALRNNLFGKGMVGIVAFYG